MGTAGGAPHDSLTAKVEELGRMCARLGQENAELRAQVSELRGHAQVRGPRGGARAATGTASTATRRGSLHAADEAPAAAVTRRVLGKALGAAAAGAVGAVALADVAASPAAASNGSSVAAGNVTTAEARTSVLYDGLSGFGGVVLLGNDSTYDGSSANFPAALGGWAGAGSTAGSGGVPSGIYGFTDNGGGYGVVGVNSSAVGSGGSGVLGQVNDADVDAVTGINNGTGEGAIGVHGVITNPGPDSAAVRGQNRGTGTTQGIGVWASHSGGGTGVLAQSASGTGLRADGGTGIGVNASGAIVGVAASGTTAVQAIGVTAVQAIGQGAAGVALSAQAVGTAPTIDAGNTGSGPGVRGGGGSAGRGGVFSGGPAQVQLVPGTGSTHPKGGQRGDLYADKTGRLWFCKKSGTTATWHQIA